MRNALVSSGILLVVLLAGCGDSGPDATIDTVDDLLASICGVAGACPGLSPTQAEYDQCPLELRSELSPSQLAELEQFLGYTETQQTCALECMGVEICDRFGGGLSSISDSDVIEPYRSCVQQCL